MGLLKQAQAAAPADEAPDTEAPDAEAAEPNEQETQPGTGEEGAALTAPSDQSGGNPQLDQALDALHQVMYASEKGSKSVVGQLRPDNKIGSVIYVTTLLMAQISGKLKITDHMIVVKLIQEIVKELVEVFTRVKKVTFSKEEHDKAVTAAVAVYLKGQQQQGQPAPQGQAPDQGPRQLPGQSQLPEGTTAPPQGLPTEDAQQPTPPQGQ